MGRMNIMNIGIDISAVVYGTGVSDYTKDLVSQLIKTNSDNFTLFGSSLRRQQDILNIFPQAKITFLPPTALDLLWNKFHLVGVEQFVGKIDVWHSSDWTEPPAKAAKVTTVHDLSPFLYPAEMDSKIVEVHTRKMKWAVKECRKFICVSQNTAQDLQRLFNVAPDRIVVIPEALPSRYLRSARLTKYTNYLVAIGARQPRKNIQALISAYLKFKDSLDLPKKLIIIGENAEKVTDPSIFYTGYVDDQTLVDLLAGAEAFVYPSLYEGFGLPILGAFQHQVPVAASNASSIPEVAGNAAILFDPGNEDEMAKSIRQAIDQKQDLIKEGSAQLQKFSWASAAADTLAVYKSIC